MPSISGVCESYYQSDGSTNLFEKQLDVCVLNKPYALQIHWSI